LIDLALNNNPSTRASWSQAKAASASVGEARSLYYPWVRADFTGGYDNNYLPTMGGPTVYSRNQATVFLSMEYVLLDFGRRAADVGRTIALFNALGLSYQRKLQETIFAVQKVYFAHEASLWRKKATERNLAFTMTLADMIARENVTGLSAVPELMQARKRVLEAQYEVEAATAVVKNTLGELCVVVGVPANTPLHIAETEPPVSTKKLRGDADELVRRALLVRPDIAARAAEVKASKEATKRAVADFFPTIKLEGQYIGTGVGYTATQGTQNGFYNPNGAIGYSGFVTASWDIFDGFNRAFKVRQRQEEDKVAEKNLEDTKLSTTRDVWTSYNDALASEERVKFAEGFVQSTQESFNATKAAIETGLTNVTDFVEAGSNLASAQSEMAKAVSDYSTSLALLAFSVGTTTPEPGHVPENLGTPGHFSKHMLSDEIEAVKQPRSAF
jgi:outer membrane protein